MQWTKDKPTDFGRYWYCEPKIDWVDVFLVTKFKESGPFFALPTARKVDELPGYWYGPIEPPPFTEQEQQP